MIKSFFVLLLLAGFSLQSLARKDYCVSQHMVRLHIDGEEILLVISAAGQELIYNLDRDTSLVVQVNSNSASLRSPNGSGSAIKRPLNRYELSLVEAIKKEAQGNLSEWIKPCRATADRNTPIPFTYALEPEEIAECKQLAEQVRDLKGCIGSQGCDGVYAKYYDQGELRRMRQFSFRQLLETGDGHTKIIAVGVASAAAWTWDLALVRFILRNKEKLVLQFTRLGVVIGGIGVSAVSYLFVPAVVYFFGEDNCRKSSKSADFALADCIGKTTFQLGEVLQKRVNLAVQNPAEFHSFLRKKENALEARLTCTLLENIAVSWDETNRGVSCQGKMLDLPDGKSYQILDDSHFLRNDNNFYSYHFDLEQNKLSVQTRADGIPDLPITEKIKDELETLQMLRPRLNELLPSCEKSQSAKPVTPDKTRSPAARQKKSAPDRRH